MHTPTEKEKNHDWNLQKAEPETGKNFQVAGSLWL